MKQYIYIYRISQLSCLIFSLLCVVDGFSQTWTQLADMPGNPNSFGDTRIGATSFTVANKIYMGTGIQLYNNEYPKKDIFEYNISTNTWFQRSDIPVQRAFAVSFTINGKGYLGTGDIAVRQGFFSTDTPEPVSDFYEYNPATDQWILRQSVEPQGRYGAVGFSINGKGYIAMGARDDIVRTSSTAVPLTSIREYNPITNTWTEVAPASEGFLFAQVFVLNSKAFITGGIRKSVNGLVLSSLKTNEYTPTSNSWATKAELPPILNPTTVRIDNSRAHAISFGLLDRGYIIGGQIYNAEYDPAEPEPCSAGYGRYTNPGCIQQNILRYNPYLNVWTQISNTTPFTANQGIELATSTEDDCSFGYTTAGRTREGANFKQFKFDSGVDSDYIQGPATVCSTPNSTFTLQLSNSGTVTWTTSSNLTIVSGQGTKDLVVKAKSLKVRAPGWVQVSINLGCRTVDFPQKTFWVGPPIFSEAYVDGLPYSGSIAICPGEHMISVFPTGGILGPTIWEVPVGITHVVGDNTLTFVMPDNITSLQIRARPVNGCGPGLYTDFNFTKKTTDCGGQQFRLSVSPNPGKDVVTVEGFDLTDNAVSIEEVLLVDDKGKVVGRGEPSYGKMFIDVSNLRKGLYFLNAKIQQEIIQERLLIEN